MARTSRRHTRNAGHPVVIWGAVILAILVWQVIAQYWILAALAGIPLAYILGRNRDRATRRKLVMQLAAAKESAELAWDASASYDAASAAAGGGLWQGDAVSAYPTDLTKARINSRYGRGRDGLINDPRSGAGPLIPD